MRFIDLLIPLDLLYYEERTPKIVIIYEQSSGTNRPFKLY